MTIRREKQKIVITCDTCGQFRKDDRWRPYNVAWQEAIAAGWVSPQRTATTEPLLHYCPEHASETQRGSV